MTGAINLQQNKCSEYGILSLSRKSVSRIVLQYKRPLISAFPRQLSDLKSAGICFGATMIGIYAIENTVTHKFYIGQSVNVKKRLSHHLTYLRGGYHVNVHLQRAFNLDGEKSFLFRLVKVCTPEELDYWERTLIQRYDSVANGYNLESGGGLQKNLSSETRRKISEKHKGITHSEEARRRMSESKKGMVPWNKGRPSPSKGKKLPPRSEEWRRKMSEAKKGKPSPNKGVSMSEEQKRKISESKKGKPSNRKGATVSEEQKRKISKSNKLAWIVRRIREGK